MSQLSHLIRQVSLGVAAALCVACSTKPTENGDGNGTSADLSITNVSDSSTVKEASEIEFLVTVTNNGPDEAINVVARDSLDVGLTYVSHAASDGSTFDPATKVWAIIIVEV